MTGLHSAPQSRKATLLAILKQSWPVLISSWAGMAFGVLDTAMTGHASPTDLATMALSIAIYISVFIGLIGVMHALIPIQAQHFGAGELKKVGKSWKYALESILKQPQNAQIFEIGNLRRNNSLQGVF